MLARKPKNDVLREAPSMEDPSICAFVRQSIVATEVLHVFGEIDLSNVEELDLAMETTFGLHPDVVIDLAGCTYIDSSGLRAIGRAYVNSNGKLRVVVPDTGAVRRIFDITGMTNQLGLFSTVDTAIA
jgi:anti-anti-sigma factor